MIIIEIIDLFNNKNISIIKEMHKYAQKGDL